MWEPAITDLDRAFVTQTDPRYACTSNYRLEVWDSGVKTSFDTSKSKLIHIYTYIYIYIFEEKDAKPACRAIS